MQSINAGFQKLKRLLPVNDGQKLSKAAILQHASEYIQQIQHENLSLREQNTLLRGKDNLREDNTITATLKREHQQQHQQQQQSHPHQQLQTLEELTDLQQPIANVVEVISDRVAAAAAASSSPNNNNNSTATTTTTSNNINNKINNDAQSSACRAQAAIALPLEVPYTSETAMHSDHRHHGLNPGVPKESTPKGQNLNTILQAIVEIEGNRMQFNS